MKYLLITFSMLWSLCTLGATLTNVGDINVKNTFAANMAWAVSGGGTFDPATISGVVCGFTPAGLSAFNTGDNITSWADASGNGRDLTTAVGPICTNNAEAIRGSKWAIFNGVSSSMMYSSSGWGAPQPNTMFVVALINGSATGVLFSGSTTTSNNSFGVYGGSFYHYMNAGTDRYGSSVNAPVWEVFEVTFNGASTEVRTNGVVVTGTPSASPGTNSMNGMHLGNDYDHGIPLNGGIAEFWLFNTNLPTADRNSMSNYFKGKYF